MYNKLRVIKFIICFYFLISQIYSQTKTGCEKIFEKPDTIAHYGQEKIALRQYVQAKLIPILGDCIKQKMEFVNSMTIQFTINEKDSVINVDFLKPKLSDYCREKLKAEILTMKEWHSGKIGDKKVCSFFTYEIAGIKWH